MKLRSGAATLPKRGNSAEENEDAYAPVAVGVHSVPFRCAIADGATETSFSGLWAQLLTEHFCTVASVGEFQQQLPSLREKWRAITSSKSLPWYAEEKLKKGAFATLIAVNIEEADFPHLKWTAVSIGDSVLFHVKNGEVCAKFPSLSSDSFKERPMLLSTNDASEDQDRSLYQTIDGVMEEGDFLFLASDKVAEWIVRGMENETKPFESLAQLTRTENSFEQFIDGLVLQNEIKNDDYTLLWVQACGDEA